MSWVCKCGRPILVDDDTFDVLVNKVWTCRGKGLYTREGAYVVNMSYFIIDSIGNSTPDHIDRDSHNNQRDNLRLATKQQQVVNRGINKSNTTGFIGVIFQGHLKQKPWRGQVTKDRKVYCKYFSTAIEAAKWRDRKAFEFFGEFASLNFSISSSVDDKTAVVAGSTTNGLESTVSNALPPVI